MEGQQLFPRRLHWGHRPGEPRPTAPAPREMPTTLGPHPAHPQPGGLHVRRDPELMTEYKAHITSKKCTNIYGEDDAITCNQQIPFPINFSPGACDFSVWFFFLFFPSCTRDLQTAVLKLKRANKYRDHLLAGSVHQLVAEIPEQMIRGFLFFSFKQSS